MLSAFYHNCLSNGQYLVMTPFTPLLAAYDYDPKTFEVTDEMLQVFDWDGGVIIK